MVVAVVVTEEHISSQTPSDEEIAGLEVAKVNMPKVADRL